MQTACTGSNARQVAVLRLYHVQQCLASSTDALTTATVFVLNLDSALDHREMERDRVFFFFFIWFIVPLSLSLLRRNTDSGRDTDMLTNRRTAGQGEDGGRDVVRSRTYSASLAPCQQHRCCLFPWRYRPAIKDSWSARWSDLLTHLMFGYATLVVLVDRAEREKQPRNLCAGAKITSKN